MALIKWDDSYAVNVAEIDQQHQQLVAMINELSDAMRQAKGKAVLGKIVDGLIGYTKSHFKLEENYFDRFGYPEAASHKKEHLAFMQKVSDFKDGFEQGRIALTIEILYFLSDWLRNHIKGTDKKYSQFFNDKGLK